MQGAGLSIRSPDWRNGLSLYGGLGILSEGGGNDFYHATGGNCMGSSYFMSIGALVDHGGEDKYIPESGYGVGFAVHLSNAALIDHSGNDFYLAKTHTGGVGSDRSVAILADYAGDDIYGPSVGYVREALDDENTDKRPANETEIDASVHNRMAGLSYGAAQKHKALGFLIDYGGNDKYYGRRQGWGESCGGVMPPQFPQNWSHAVLLDLGGNDFYLKTGARDNHYFRYQQHGICYDTEYTGSARPGKQSMPRQQRMAPHKVGPATAAKHAFDGNLSRLNSPDLFERFAAIGKIEQQGPEMLEPLLRILATSADEQINRDIIEVITYFYVKQMLRPKHFRPIVELLKAPDPFVRKFTARLLGWWQATEALPFLLQVLDQTPEDVQAHIARALGNIGSYQALDRLMSMARGVSSPDARQAAFAALRTIAINGIPNSATDGQTMRTVLLQSLRDPDEVVRAHAAFGLFAFADDAEVDRSVN